jgi:hypothetical protein
MHVSAVAVVLTLGLLTGGAAVASAQTAASGPRQLQLSFDANGLVTLRAQNVSVREVLAEWARQCGCFVVNAQNLTATIDIPVQFERAPQAQVLQSLLRRAAGYVLTPKRAGSTGPSQYETIYVVATSTPSAPTTYVPPPVFTPVPPPTAGAPADEIPPVTPIATLPDPASPPPSAPTPAAPAATGTRSRFVPIVPIGPGSSNTPRPTPGGVTPAPNTSPAPPPADDRN